MTIGEQNRYEAIPRNGDELTYSFNFDYDNPDWILVEWGTSLDRQLWQKLTLGTDYTITKTFGGGEVTFLIDPNSLVDNQGLPFAWLSIQSDYPYSQEYSLPNNYSLGTIDFILTYIEIQIQQVWSIVEQILTIPGLWISLRLIAYPNERGRIPKIDSDDGTMLFKGSALIDDDIKVESEIDFYAKKDTFLQGNTSVSGLLSGVNASFTGDLNVSGTGTFTELIANEGIIDLIFSDTGNIDEINSTNINNSGTLQVGGVATFQDTINSVNILNTNDITSLDITANSTMSVENFLRLRGTNLYPIFSSSLPGDFLILKTNTTGANFDLVSRPISGATGIVNSRPRHFLIAGEQTDPLAPVGVESDMIESSNAILVNAKDLEISTGDLKLVGSNAVFDNQSGKEKIQNKNILWRTDTFKDGYVLSINELIIDGQLVYEIISVPGGGGGSILINEGFYAKGGALNDVVEADTKEVGNVIHVISKDLQIDAGSFSLPSGIISANGVTLKVDLSASSIGQVLLLSAPVAGEESLYDYLLTSTTQSSGGGGGGTLTVSENVFAMGGPAGSGTINDAPVSLSNTDVVTDSGWSFRSNTLKTNRLRLNPDGYYLNMSYDPKSNSKNINATWNLNLDWMNAGEIKGVSLRKVDDENCIIFPLAESPPTPVTPGSSWVDNSVASFRGWDSYQEKQISSNNNAIIYEDVVENWDFRVLNVKTLAFNYQTRTPIVSGSDVILDFNPNLRAVNLVSYTDSITEIRFNEAMYPGSTVILYFICDESGQTVTFPADWYWPNGYNKFTSIATKMVGVEIYCNSDNEIYAQFIRSGTTFDVGTIRPIPPFVNFGTTKYETIFGGQMSSTSALTYDLTLEKWQFPLAKIKVFSSPVRVLTAVAGVLTIPLDGNYSAFEYTHDTDLISILITIDSELATDNLAWNLRIITGTSMQKTLPVPDGCMVSESNWVIKDGNAFVEGLWTNTRMFIMPISAFDFV